MDYLIKSLALQDQVRVYLVTNKDVLVEAIKRHDLWPSAASVLGKTLSMGLMMGGMLKNDEALTIKINGNGPIGNIIVDANGQGDVRGYVDHSHVNFVNQSGGLSDATTIGTDGLIEVIKDLKLKDFFTSTIECTGDLADDFTHYFMESDQTPSAVCLAIEIGVDNLPQVCGGIVFQLLPNATEDTITRLEKAIGKIGSVSSFFKEHTLEEMLEVLFDNDYSILSTQPVRFHCPCNKETFAKGLITLGEKDLMEILEEDKKIETVCHYCKEVYHFDEQELQNLIKEVQTK